MSNAIERLCFDADSAVSAAEAAIHLNRYLLGCLHAKQRRVLDLSCGEGYGTYFLANLGEAARVDGVDISEEAIAAARKNFPDERIRYHVHAGEEIDTLFEPETFDLVVCLETFEHVLDPALLLSKLKGVLKPDGVLIVSCPNDHLYYLTPEEGNPFHVRKYTFEAFRELTEAVLGPARVFQLGVPLNGYVNLTPDEWLANGPQSKGNERFTTRGPVPAYTVPPQEAVNWETCSYYVGIWAPAEMTLPPSAVLYGSTMHANAPAAESTAIANLRDEVIALRSKVHDCEQGIGDYADRHADVEPQLNQARCELRDMGLRATAMRVENEFLREELRAAKQDVSERRTLLDAQEAQLLVQTTLLNELQDKHAQLQAQQADWQRRIENVERMKRWIPSPLRWLMRRR